MRNKFLLVVMMLFMAMGSGGVTAAPYAVYCEGNQTLYFLSSETAQNVGGIHNGQTITAVWSGTQVTETGFQPNWRNYNSSVESVVFEDSFKDVPPKNLYEWFYGFTSLSSVIGIENLNTSNAKSMYSMFNDCRSLTELDLSSFDTSKVTEMGAMFYNCSSLESLNLSSFNTSNVTTMDSMFKYCSGLTSLDLSSFNTSNAEHMSSMFYGCSSLTELDLSSFNTSKVKKMNQMFYSCSSLKYIYKSDGFVINNGTEANNMYSNCNAELLTLTPCVVYCAGNQSLHFMRYADEKLTNGSTITIDGHEVTLADNNYLKGDAVITTGSYGPLSSIKKNVLTAVFDKSFKSVLPTTCYRWFYDAQNLTEIKGIEYLNTSNVTSMYAMFGNCKRLTSLDLSHFDTSDVTDMGLMFSSCESLTSIDLSNFNMSKVTKIVNMFSNCNSLTKLNLRHCVGDIGLLANHEKIAKRGMMIIVPEGTDMQNSVSEENYIVTANGTSFVRQFTEGNMSTVCLPFAVSASNEGGTFYRYDSYDGTDVVFKKVTEGMTEANTAYLFMPSATGKVTFTGNTALASLPADIIEGEEAGLYGVYTKKTFTADDAAKNIYYGWAEGQFWRAGEGAAVNPNRAYLKLPAAAAARLSVRLDGNGTTGISTAGSSADNGTDAPVYNLQGQRVGGSYKGVVIKNGKKMIVK